MVESREGSREIGVHSLKIDVRNQAGAGKMPRRSDLANRALTGTLANRGSAGPREIRLKPENAPRTRFSAVGRQIPGAFCKSCLKIGETVGRAARRGGPCSKAEIRGRFRSKSGPQNCSVDLHYKSGVGIQIFPAEKKPGFCALGRKRNCAFFFPRENCEVPRRKQLTQKSSPRSKNPAGFCTI